MVQCSMLIYHSPVGSEDNTVWTRSSNQTTRSLHTAATPAQYYTVAYAHGGELIVGLGCAGVRVRKLPSGRKETQGDV